MNGKTMMFEFGHQAGDQISCGKSERSFRQVDLPVLSGPFLDIPEPFPVHHTKIIRIESVVPVIETDQISESPDEFRTLHPVHLPLALNAKQIPNHAPARPRFELALDRLRYGISILLLLHDSSVIRSRYCLTDRFF